jgi:DNA repair ATPase RecN
MSERDVYVEKMKAKLDEWNAELEKLSARMSTAEADAKLEYQKMKKHLIEQRDEATQRLDKLQSASENAWQDMRKGFESAWGIMGKTFVDAVDRFK